MESQNLEPIEMMRTETKKMTKMMERMMEMMERMMIEGKEDRNLFKRMMIEAKEDRNLFKKCLRDTVRKPEIYQDAFGTP